MECRSVVFRDESRFCLYASDGRTCGLRRRPDERHLLECIRLRHTGPTSAISYNSRSHSVFLLGKVNSARYIAQIVNPVLLPFLRQEGDVFFSRTTHVHISPNTFLYSLTQVVVLVTLKPKDYLLQYIIVIIYT